ncbi:MAG: alpha/beta hydrolase [Sphingomonas sp.]|uniref:alpha/beta fold hydrolase n=1 Tax=Sphingomonas sp. TaxID=28214 RepID=UPI0025DB3114|nr:alpha/beta hydrolase [Sphingomonas sp.]MBY0285132.1 alpha/beta hydrolase [Sphingomonas sp.]
MAGHENQFWENRYWWSRDGVRLHARDYAPRDAAKAAGRPPILCLPGLTRNARDYDNVATRLSAEWRVLAVNLRGRGESGYAKDPMTYVPLTYVQDVEALLTEIGADRYIAFGTSLGGIVTMLLAGAAHEQLVGALLNDVGPDIDPAGLARIRGYVGRSHTWPTWMHAARAVAEANADTYPDYAIGDWLAMAKRLYRVNAAGRIVLDYDMKIAEPFRVPGNEAGPDMWRALDRLKGLPVAVVRGGTSDILPATTATRMVAELPGATLTTVPRTGHAPTLAEPEAAAAIDALLARITEQAGG